jgi:hypothetical protein
MDSKGESTGDIGAKLVPATFFGRAGAVLVVGLLACAAARAETVSLSATGDPDVPSYFTLDFGDAGGVSSGHIAATELAVEINADRSTARFARYYQEVEPLTLPGGYSTGNLTIETVGEPSDGTFDLRTGQLVTLETYAIHFEGDLSAFGLESPVILESASTGYLSLDTDTGGHFSLEWTGTGELANPSDPGMSIVFSYFCTVNATFPLEPAAIIRLGLVPEVLKLALPPGIEKSLLHKLTGAAHQVEWGNPGSAAGKLRAFVNAVNALARRQLSAGEAEFLTETTVAVIIMLEDELATGSRLRADGRKVTARGTR